MLFNEGSEYGVNDVYYSFGERAAAPNTPEAGQLRLYAKDNGSGEAQLCYKNDAGNEVCLPTSGVIPSGVGSGGAVAIWSTAAIISSDPTQLFWDFTNNRLGIGTVTPTQSLDVQGGQIRAAIVTGTVVISAQSTAALAIGESTRMIGGGVEGTNTHAADLRVTKRGASNEATASLFLFNGSVFAERFRFSYDYRLAFGAWAPDNVIDIRGGDNASTNIQLKEASADTVSPGLVLLKARGTIGSEAATASGDTLGNIGFGGWTNAYKFNAARIEALAGSLWTATNAEAIINFQTTPSGSVTRATRFQIGSAGQWGIGGATFGSTGNYIRSAGAAAPPVWSTLVLPNTATINRIPFASATDTWTDSANLTFDGSDLGLGSGIRARMQSQNRFRYLNAMASVTKSANQTTLTNSTWNTVSFNQEDFDTDSMHDNATDNSRLTAKVAGKYLVSGAVYIDDTNIVSSQTAGLRFIKNGGTTVIYGQIFENTTTAIPGAIMSAGSIVSLAVNDYMEMQAFCAGSSGTFDVFAGGPTTRFGMVYIGE